MQLYSSLGEQKGIFPGGLAKNSRLCVVCGFLVIIISEKQGMVLLGCVCAGGRAEGGKGISPPQGHPCTLQLGFGFSHAVLTTRGVW